MDINGIREQYPQYKDIPDGDLADAFHTKYYSSMPREEFDKKIGLTPLDTSERVEDAAKSFGSGAVKGVRGLAALPHMADAGAAWLTKKFEDTTGIHVPEMDMPRQPVQEFGASMRAKALGALGITEGQITEKLDAASNYKPKTEIGEASKLVGEFAPGAIGGGGLIAGATRAGKYALAPGLGAYAGQKATEGSDLEPYGEAIGGIAGLVGGSSLNRLAEWGARKTMTSADDFERAATRAYDKADQAGVVIKPQVMSALKTQLDNALDNAGHVPKAEQRASATIEKVMHDLTEGTKRTVSTPNKRVLGNLFKKPVKANQGVTLREFDKITRRLATSAKSQGIANQSDAKFLWQAKHFLDDAASQLNQSHVLAGDAKKGMSALREAKDYWTQKSKLQLLDQMEEAAEHTGKAVYTRAGVPHANRREFLKFLKKPQHKRQRMTPDELTAMDKVADGGFVTNTARSFGKLADGGALGSRSTVSGLLGYMAGGAPGAIAAGLASVGVGGIAKNLHKFRINKHIHDARATIINKGQAGGLRRPWNTALGKLYGWNTATNVNND